MPAILGLTAITLAALLIGSGFKGRALWDDVLSILKGQELAASPVKQATSPVAVSNVEPSTLPVWQGTKVPIGQGSMWLAPPAHAAFKRAEQMYGGTIKLSGAGRTREEQIALRKKNGCPDIYNSPSNDCKVPTAIPGTSQHEFGNAVDVHSSLCQNSRIIDAMTKAGWCRYNPQVECWHWSYTVCK